MAPKPNYYTLTPPILNKDAPAPLALEVRFDATPSAVKLHFTFNNSDVALTPDASGKVFTTSVPPAALLTNFDDTDVFRHVIGQLQVSLGGEHDQYWISGNVLTAAIPPVSVQPVAADIQFSDHVVNINFPLPDPYSQVTLQLENICKKFFTAFDDEYDFLQLVFVRSYFENRDHGASRNDIKGIGQSQFNNDAQFGSAGRMLGYSGLPYPTDLDDEYEFLQLLFVRSYFENRYHGASRNDIKGIGQSQFNNDAQFGSAGRMLGYSVFPYPT